MSIFPEPIRKLRLIGGITALLYSLVAVVFWTDAMFNRTRIVEGLLLVTVSALAILYFAGIRYVAETGMRTIVGFAAFFAVAGFIITPFDSTDVAYYMAQGWHQSHYNGNPYSQVLRDIPNGLQDPMIGARWMQLNRNPWLDEPLPYGFGFALVTRVIAWLGDGNWWLTLGLFNLLNLSIHGVVAYLLWKTAGLIGVREPKLVLYLYAWSPLIVLQYLANVHNDIIMAGLIILAFYLLQTGRAAWVLPALVTAGLVKYVAFVLAPFALILVFRRYGWKAALKGMLASAVIIMIVSAPYIGAIRSFKFADVLLQFTESTGSLHAFIVLTVRAIGRMLPALALDPGTFSSVSKTALWALVAGFAIREIPRAWSRRNPEPAEVAAQWTAILFAVIFVGSSQFYSWYIGILFPLALIGIGTSALTDAIVLLSGTHVLGFTFIQHKSVGYFLLSTAVPLTFLIWRRIGTVGIVPILALGLPLKPMNAREL